MKSVLLMIALIRVVLMSKISLPQVQKELMVVSDILVSFCFLNTMLYNYMKYIVKIIYLKFFKEHILEECYPHTKNIIVSKDKNVRVLEKLGPIATTLISFSSHDVPFYYLANKRTDKERIDIFILIADSPSKLTDRLSGMTKVIQFYDIKPKLYLMFVTHKDDCLLDGTLFTYTFDRNPLNLFIFCYSAFNDLLIFTYNSYIDFAHKHSDFTSFGEFYYAYYKKGNILKLSTQN